MVATVGYTRFKKGARIVVCLKDGLRVTGTFLGSGSGMVGIFTQSADGREGTLLLPKKAIAFMRANGA
jgi:hypothetical protein